MSSARQDPPSESQNSDLAGTLQAVVAEILAGRHAGAIEMGGHALLRFPNDAMLHYNLGLANANLGRPAQAITHYRKAIEAAPKDPRIHNNLSGVLLQTGSPEEALGAAEEAIRLKPDYTLAILNRANALLILDRPDEALQAFETVVSKQPALANAAYKRNLVKALSNQGVALHMNGNFERSLMAFDRALTLDPSSADARFNRACSLLLQGDYEGGWQGYEARWDRIEDGQDQRRYPSESQWNGQTPLAGKTVLVWAEQGFGDTIQFSRYLSLVKAKGARIVFEVQPALKGLLGQLKDASVVVCRGDPIPAFDLHCPLMSLPKLFATRSWNLPGVSQLLQADPKRVSQWKTRLGSKNLMRIGLAWSGTPGHTFDRTRSLSLAQLLPLTSLGCEVICLQKDVRAEDWPFLQGLGIRDFSPELQDFEDTAALIDCMDLVVAVDTSVAHLAGSMGKPTLLMLWKYPDWRWGLLGQSTGWYESVRLIRQEIRGDWEAVVEKVVEQIRLRLSLDFEPSQSLQNTTVLLRRALALYQSGKPKETELLARHILSLDESHVDAANLLAVLAAQDSRFEESEKLFLRVAQLRPNFYEAFTNRGNALAQLKRFPEAVECYQRATQIDSSRADAHLNLGLSLQKSQRKAEAIEALQKALSIQPKNVNAQVALGNLLRETGGLEAALSHYEQALAINPDFAVALSNRAITLTELNRFDEAMRDHERACELYPDSGEVQFNRSLTLLLLGRFQEGWKAYEWRWKRKDVIEAKVPRSYSQPLWLNDQPLEGKTIFLWAEQGLGDTLQMVRAAQWIKEKAAKVLLEVQRPLFPLLSQLEGVDQLVAKGDPVPPFDFHCPLMSIPLAYSLTDQSKLWSGPYVFAPQDERQVWAERFGERKRLRIGLVWAGNPRHGSDQFRSIPLEAFEPLFQLDADFYGLQKEIRPGDEKKLSNYKEIRNFGPHLSDFRVTAGILENLDILVSVDTSVAHLAGAMGKPVALLIAPVPDWRWLREREDTPWYPSMRLFRKKLLADWEEAVGRVADALRPHTKNTQGVVHRKRTVGKKV